MLRLSAIELFLFDVDGVLWLGKDRPRYLSGKRLLSRIKTMGKKSLVLTNTSTDTRSQIHAKLTTLGFEVQLEQILTSSQLLAEYLHAKYGPSRCFLIGEEGLARELKKCGHTLVDRRADLVVVGLDRKLTYRKLDAALQMLRTGAKLVVSYMGTLYMSADGPALSAGPIAKALEYASGEKATAIGKPAPLMFRMALKLARAKPEKTLMMGDQIETDIRGARNVGIRSALVLSGVESLDSLRSSNVKPDLVVRKADDLVELL